MKQLATAALLCVLPQIGGSHPHIFVDSTLHFRMDAQDRVTEVEVTWVYDDFFTLLIFEDLGLDPDGDAQLTEAEMEKLWGFDLENWYEGFEGDLYLTAADGSKVALGTPVATHLDVIDGKIHAAHKRPVTPVSPKGLEVWQYDPTFYVAYTVTGGVHFERGCAAQVIHPDLNDARLAQEAALAEILAEDERLGDSEDIFQTVELGIHYADRVRITCDGLS
ncbi:DUF1007 family protein [Primorskyibacter sp. S187A]|uniref:DUF1007 family protein n=1 Tax=Primorskyibacter sp. S187A TaxID=3415130 RepID=UPI003C7DE5A6